MSAARLFVLLLFSAGTALAPSPAAAVLSDERVAASQVVEDIESWTGVRFAVLESKLRRSIVSTDTPWGFKIRSVRAGSAAERAGLRRGDVVMRVDGEPLREVSEFRRSLLEAGPGARIALEVSRRRSRASLLDRHPWETIEATLRIPAPDIEAETGIRFAVLESVIARSVVSTAAPYGLMVAEVAPDSPASRAGIRSGDVVLKWNDAPLKTPAQIQWSLIGVAGEREVDLEVARRSRTKGRASRSPWDVFETVLDLGRAAHRAEGKDDP